MFSQASVILFTRGACMVGVYMGACMVGGSMGSVSGGGHVWWGCMVGGMHG